MPFPSAHADLADLRRLAAEYHGLIAVADRYSRLVEQVAAESYRLRDKMLEMQDFRKYKKQIRYGMLRAEYREPEEKIYDNDSSGINKTDKNYLVENGIDSSEFTGARRTSRSEE